MNIQTAKYLALHISSVIVAVATAVYTVGPQRIEDLFSHDPVKIIISVSALIVSVAAALGAAKSGALFTEK